MRIRFTKCSALSGIACEAGFRYGAIPAGNTFGFCGAGPRPAGDALVGFREVCRFQKSRTGGAGADQGIRPTPADS